MEALIDHIKEAESSNRAVGHFNISNIEGFWAVIEATLEVSEQAGFKVPVIIGVSEGEREFIGVRQAKALVESAREELEHPIFLNADHTYSFEKAKIAIDAGYDSVIIDGAALDFDQNVTVTKRTVEYARSVGSKTIVEAELGYIGTSSKVLDEIPEDVKVSKEFLTDPLDAQKFVEATGIDLLAPAVGNLHGMLKNAQNPALDIERIAEIRKLAAVPLVLHGGSGVSDEDFTRAIDAGISEIHVSTEIRRAYRDAVEKSWKDQIDEIAPYRLMRPVIDAMKQVVKNRLLLFNKL
jgi:fructose-bisphosphate aldolase class II